MGKRELFEELVFKGRFRESLARKCVAKILSAVAHCHICDIVHRNLKPENIMLGPRKTNFDQLKIVDFGDAVEHTNTT